MTSRSLRRRSLALPTSLALEPGAEEPLSQYYFRALPAEKVCMHHGRAFGEMRTLLSCER